MANANLIVAENLQPGTDDWQLMHPATSREIEGYASATSVNRGDAIELFVNTASPTFVLDVFRMGWYQGLGARRIVAPIEVAGTAQNPAAAYGMGAGEFLTNLQPHPDVYKVSNAGWDYNMVRWVEREEIGRASCRERVCYAV